MGSAGDGDPYGLERFVEAQAETYASALAEVRAGSKRTHWMWFVFPQIEGLGHSMMARHFAIKSLEEARAYLEHPVLGPRIVECAEAVLSIRGRTMSDVFGYPDDLKLRSSMTLFAEAAGSESVFARVVERCFACKADERTLELLGKRT
jgi:uncharacterized protein (DUF1810 family)